MNPRVPDVCDDLDVIARRVSCRDYRPDPVDLGELQSVVAAGEAAERLTACDLRLHLVVSGERIEGEVKGILGDYGKVIRAPHYVVLSAVESAGYLIDAGYRFEQLVLDATRRGLGTCWVGGFFREVSLRDALGLDRGRRVVALTPLGHPAERAGLLGRAVRAWVRGSSRKPVDELFFWGRHGEPLPQAWRNDPSRARLLEAVRRAPSWANRQPWRFVVGAREVVLYKQARQIKEGKDYHLVDCGIAMSHFHLAARRLDLGGQWLLGAAEVPGAADAEPIARYVFGDRSARGAA